VQLATGHIEAEWGGRRLGAVVDAEQGPADVDPGLLAEGLERQRDAVADFGCR
jgi:hypothetical protein